MPEHAPHHGERHEAHQPKPELEAARAEALNEIKTDRSENSAAEAAKERAEAAREVIKQHEAKAEEPASVAEAAPSVSPVQRLLDHTQNYVQTLTSMQRQLPPLSRRFSKVIHTPAVEKTSEALENTVARPSVMVGATWTALLVGVIFYLTARHFDYALSGSEMIFSFVVGAVIGLFLESLFHAVRRK